MTKKVLHIIDSLGLGGAQTVVRGIMEYEQNDIEFHLYALRHHDIQMDIEAKNIHIYNSHNKFSFPLFTLRTYIKENNINILHCHLAKSQIIGGLLKKLFFPKIKLVFHEHGEILQEGKIYQFLMNCYRNILDKYIAVSQFTKDTILQKTNVLSEKIQVLYNFVDNNKFYPYDKDTIKKERQKLNIPTNNIVVGFASRIYEGKGWKEFVAVAKKMIQINTNITFLIAGDGPEVGDLKSEIVNEKNICHLGYYSDMPLFYNLLDIFIFPSHREAMPMTILEVSASRKTIIASDISGVNEIMLDEKNALLFERGNSECLFKDLDQLLQDFNLRKTLADNAYKNIQRYVISTYFLGLKDLYFTI